MDVLEIKMENFLNDRIDTYEKGKPVGCVKKFNIAMTEESLKSEYVGMVIHERTGIQRDWIVKDVCFYIYPHISLKFIRGLLVFQDTKYRLWFEIIYDPVSYTKEKAIEEIKDQISLRNTQYPNTELHTSILETQEK